jgi:hypothetical protein
MLNLIRGIVEVIGWLTVIYLAAAGTLVWLDTRWRKRQMSKWQPMATAPMDGSRFLAHDATGHVSIASFDDEYEYEGDAKVPVFTRESEIFNRDYGWCGHVANWRPIRWQPLPTTTS